MKISQLLILSLCILKGSLSSCQENDSELTKSYQCPDISGEWKWKKFVYAMGGPTITPDSLAITKTIIITDSLFSVLINDTLTMSTAYTCQPVSNSKFTIPAIRLGTGETYYPSIQADTLVLGDGWGFANKDFYFRK